MSKVERTDERTNERRCWKIYVAKNAERQRGQQNKDEKNTKENWKKNPSLTDAIELSQKTPSKELKLKQLPKGSV